ncbi:MAG: hypothetical protein ACUVTZ_13255, partial [Armatimonadota bacterium]
MKYLRAALLHPLHLAVLAAAGLTVFLSHDPELVAAVAVAESAYLLWVPKTRWFRAAVDTVQFQKHLHAARENGAALLQQIDGFSRQRYLRLQHIRDTIRQ